MKTPRSFGLGRLPAGVMNKTEAEYSKVLDELQHLGDIQWWKFEALTFKLAPDCRYTPDFAVMMANGRIQLREVKGFFTDDAKVKIKVAAQLFPFEFIIVRKKSKKDGGGWSEETV